MKRRAIITGGAGFIGSHVADRFLDEGYDVEIIDDLSSGRKANVLHVLPTDPNVITFDSWSRFLGGRHSIYLGLFWKSVRISLIVSITVVVLSYPIGYFLALCVRKRKYVLLLVIIAPFLTSYLLRVLAWKVILGSNGVVNSLLYQLHIRDPEHPQVLEIRVSESSMPSHVGLGGKKSKGVVGRYKKTVADFGTGGGGVVVRLILTILVCFGPDDVPAFAHRMPVFFRRSSRRRCCSSQ